MKASELERIAQEADATAREARRRLVSAVRDAYASGMSQRRIAAHTNRSQAEINRLIRFHGTSPRARQLRARRDGLMDLLKSLGLEDPRVFGSVAKETDTDASDIDLLVTPTRPMGLLERARAEQTVTKLLGAPVDLVFDDAIRPDLSTQILEEAVPL